MCNVENVQSKAHKKIHLRGLLHEETIESGDKLVSLLHYDVKEVTVAMNEWRYYYLLIIVLDLLVV